LNLLLWRHAEAEDSAPDMGRILTSRGREQAARVGNWIRRQVPGETIIVASPAKRTRQTADALGLPYTIDERIAPGAAMREVMLAIFEHAGTERSRATLVMVGHQPWVGQAAAQLITGQPAYWSVRKAACWWLVERRREDELRWTVRTVVDADLV
jgi:phosphohistidine phosphatase